MTARTSNGQRDGTSDWTSCHHGPARSCRYLQAMPRAWLEIRREGGHRMDRRRAYRVFVDGDLVGRIRQGESRVFEVEPGLRSVQLRVDWCRSRRLAVDAPPGEQVLLACRPNADPRDVMYWTTVGSRNYIALQMVAPPAAAVTRAASGVRPPATSA
jgi:hypothetical protein